MTGELPQGWASASVNEIAEINPRHPKGLDNSMTVTFVPMAALSESRPEFQFTKESTLGSLRKGFTHFADGDVLFAKITPCMENGKGAVATGLRNELGCGTTEVHVIRPLAGIAPHYLYYFLAQTKIRGLAKDSFTGTAGQSRVPTSFIEQLEVPLAPLPEQRRIVAKVEKLVGNVDACQARLAKIPILLKRFRQSVLSAACSGRLTADWRNKKTENGTFPRDWESRRLDSLFTVRSGGTPSRKVKEYFEGGTIPWVKTAEVQNSDIIKVDEFITEAAVNNSNAKVFPVGTILVAMYGEGKTRGQIGRLVFPAATNQASAALVNTELPKETNQYVFYFLLGQYYQLRAESVGGNQPNLNLGVIKQWQVPLPPLAEQKEIVRRVTKLFALADTIEAGYKEAQQRVDYLSQSILAKAFQGELVPTEAELAEAEGRSFESADKLLERINTGIQPATPRNQSRQPSRTKKAFSHD